MNGWVKYKKTSSIPSVLSLIPTIICGKNGSAGTTFYLNCGAIPVPAIISLKQCSLNAWPSITGKDLTIFARSEKQNTLPTAANRAH